jgi:hypothetical protein
MEIDSNCHRRTWRSTWNREKARLSPLLDVAPIFLALTERSARICHDPYGSGEYLVGNRQNSLWDGLSGNSSVDIRYQFTNINWLATASWVRSLHSVLDQTLTAKRPNLETPKRANLEPNLVEPKRTNAYQSAQNRTRDQVPCDDISTSLQTGPKTRNQLPIDERTELEEESLSTLDTETNEQEVSREETDCYGGLSLYWSID